MKYEKNKLSYLEITSVTFWNNAKLIIFNSYKLSIIKNNY